MLLWKPVLTMTERNLSINLSSNYMLEDTNKVGMVLQNIAINSTGDKKSGNATLTIMGFYNKSQVSDIGTFAEVMGDTMIIQLKLMGGKEVSKIEVNNSQGRIITIHEIKLPVTKKQLGTTNNNPGQAVTTYIAIWLMDSWNFAILTSNLDKNTTIEIAKSAIFNDE